MPTQLRYISDEPPDDAGKALVVCTNGSTAIGSTPASICLANLPLIRHHTIPPARTHAAMPIAVPILAEAGFDLAVAEGVAEALLEAEELGLGGALEIVEGLRGGFSAGELAAAFAGGAFIGAPAALVEAIAALVGAARRRRRGFRPKFRIAPVRMPPPPPVALVGSSDACRESMYAPCGNDLATLGYRALASYNGSCK